MITCEFEGGNHAQLRHVTADIIGVRDGRVLMVRRADHLVEGGKWAVPGGYMDRDEPIDVTARREFVEETGYEPGALTLFDIDSRPHRPGNERQNVSFVFVCEVGARVSEPDQESTEMQWFALGELPDPQQVAFGHDQYIRNFRNYMIDAFPLPLLDGVVLVNSLHPPH